MDALESSERANRSAIDAGMCKIKLHNFVAWDGTGVRHANGDCDGGVRGDLCLAYFRVGIIEGGETQTEAERIERRLAEVAVSPAGHGVVAKRRELDDGLIKSYRQPASRVVFAGKNVSDGGAPFLTWIPGLEDGGGMFLSPIHGERASVGEDHDQGLSRGSDGFQKLLLRPGKVEVQAISSEKTGIAGIAFLSLKLRSNADHSDHDIRLACGAHSDFREMRRQPEKPRGSLPPGVRVLHADGVRMARLQMNERGHRASAMGCRVIHELFSIQVNAIASVGTATQAVVTIHGRNELACPADGIIPRRNAGPRRNIVPLEIHAGIHTLQNRSA